MIHRFQIGTMRATIVSDGPLLLHAPEKIFLGSGRAALAECMTAAGQLADRVRVEQNCLLLETGSKRFPFDNGMRSEKLYGPGSGKLLENLALAEISTGRC